MSWVLRSLSGVIITGAIAAPAAAQLRLVPYASGFTQPVAFVQDPTDPSIQFVVEQGGRIRTVEGGTVLGVPFLDISEIVSTGPEHGLLNMIFDPHAATNGRFFVYFTDVNGNVVLARFKRSSSDPLVADRGSRLDIQWGGEGGLRYLEQPFANNKGGGLGFVPSNPPHPEDPETTRWLLVGVGDGGGSHDPGARAQDRSQWLGKILRLDVDVPDSNPYGYAVPAIDPAHPTYHPEVWSAGLRNPWRLNFVPGSAGYFYVTDSGENKWEEVNCGQWCPMNYAWPVREGPAMQPPDYPLHPEPELGDPVYVYGRDAGTSIVGGYEYHGRLLGTSFQYRYIFGDFASGRIWSFPWSGCGREGFRSQPTEHTTELGGPINVRSFGVDANGDVYLVSYYDGTIYRFDTAPVLPVFTQQPTSLEVALGAPAGFSVVVTGTPVPSVQWQVSLDAGATWTDLSGTPDERIYGAGFRSAYGFNAAPGDGGKRFRAVARNTAGTAISAVATLVVRGGYPGDLDGDRKTDLVVWRPGTGVWHILPSGHAYDSAAATHVQWGNQALGDQPVLGDIDGDGVRDLVVWRASTGTWHWVTSSSSYSHAAAGSKQWGNALLGDVPLLADLDGDGKADLVVWRPGTGTWHVLFSATGYDYASATQTQWGNQALADTPLLADMDGDRKADFVVWRPGTGMWYWLTSASGYATAAARSLQWGNQALGDRPFLGDMDGDGKADPVVWRASTGTWCWLQSRVAYLTYYGRNQQWGNAALGDVPFLTDMDGDGKADLTVWRASTGTWHWVTAASSFNFATAGQRQWGNQALGDVPVVR